MKSGNHHARSLHPSPGIRTNKRLPTLETPHLGWLARSSLGCGMTEIDMITKKKNEYDNFDILTDFENLYNAHRECRKGKRWKDSIASYDIRAIECTLYLQAMLARGTYKMSDYHCFTINERGKERNIKSTQYKDRVVQKCLDKDILKPRIVPTFIYENGASLEGKGTDFNLDELEKDMKEHYRKHGTEGYFLVGDFSKYFDSIDHDVLYRMYAKEFKDERILKLVKNIHDSINGGKGVALGNEVSQTDALMAANPIDHMVKEVLRIKYYGRYMDDFYLIHPSKEYLKYCLKEIKKKAEELGLQLNEKKTKIVPITTGINFLGFRFYMTSTGKVVVRLKAKNKNRRRRKLRKQKKLLLQGKIRMEDIQQSYDSWKAHAKRGNTYYMLRDMDKYFYGLFKDFIKQGGKENGKTTK